MERRLHSFEYPSLSYRYKSQTDLPATPTISGYGELLFQQWDARPTAYQGHYFTPEPAVYTLRGKRVSDETVRTQLATEDGKARYARQVMSLEYGSCIATVRGGGPAA